MPRFAMTVTETYTNTIEVEAADVDEAIETAREMAIERQLPTNASEVCNRTFAVSETA